MAMRVWTLALVVASGCRAPAAPEPITNSRITDDSLSMLVARADAAVAAAAVIDYALPLDTTSRRPLQEAHELYSRACLLGHAPACWKRHSITFAAYDPASRPYVQVLERHCEGGNILACRALHGFDSPKRLLGAAARAIARGKDAEESDRPLLQKECDAGLPYSCKLLSVLINEPSVLVGQSLDHGPILARAYQLAGEGCELGISNECMLVSIFRLRDLPRLKLSCRYDAHACMSLAGFLEADGRRLEARDYAERACTMGWDRELCVNLGSLYRSRTLPEPVPGRGRALLAWVCSLVEELWAEECDGIREAPDDEQP